MKLVLIRHGDPDYTIDSLTEKGRREADILSERVSRMKIDKIYISPLGRAADTAAPSLKKLHAGAVTCEWLKEFSPRIDRPDHPDCSICWDWLPQDWTEDERYYRADQWYDTEIMKAGHVREEYERVTSSFDELLAAHGYRREGKFYRAERANNDTIVFFCHFGLICVLVSHLTGISPMPLWHGLCLAPTSVTTIVTEERRKGIASFRATALGDISHLYAVGEPPAFAARFCECYDNADERHD